MAKDIRYPAAARELGIMGTVYVSFIIDKNSNLQDINIEKDIGGNCGAEVVKALTSSKYSWVRASINNKGYASKFIIPVTFLLDPIPKIFGAAKDEKFTLPDANRIDELKIVAFGTPFPIKN